MTTMTTSTDTRPRRLLDAAEHARPDTLRIAEPLTDRLELADGDPDLVKRVALLKVGTFNGTVEVTAEDLDLFTARFRELAESGTFVPPMRLDHSWDVLSVVGWFEDLYVETHPDPTNGDAPTPYLLGDFRIVGTDEERETLRAWIKGGKLRNRSSEIMPYRTNNGREYARVFAGCAFVDIPAVEGLAPITLRRDPATLSLDSTDTGRGAAVADSTEQDKTTEPDGDVVTPADTTSDGGSSSSATSAPSADTPDDAEDGSTVGDPEPEPEATGGEEEESTPREPEQLRASGLEAALRAAGLDGLEGDKLAAVRAAFDREVLRERTADERLTRYRDKGVIPLSVADRVEALLRHDDDNVRDSVAALLDLASPRVPLGDHAGTQTSPEPGDGSTITPDELRGLSGDALGEAWAALSRDQRKAPEYRDAYRHATGTVDVLGS